MYVYSQSLRDELIDAITDADLEFSPTENNPRLARVVSGA